MILAGDIGGTKTHLALFSFERGRLALRQEWTVASRSATSLDAVITATVGARIREVSAAAFGVAGPVVRGRCEATNLPWIITTASLARLLKTRAVALLNDLEALAYGLETLAPRQLTTLNRGRAQARGARVVLAAGTGLGEAGLVWDGSGYRAVPSEGGHTDFAPRTEEESRLLRYLRMRHRGHVSYERILSGPGKLAIYEFLRDTTRAPEPAWLRRRLADSNDPSAVVSAAALDGRSRTCASALRIFAGIYGAEAGNLALKFLATGGVYVGGGIAPTILPRLTDGTFMQAFLDKGRFRALLATVPVHIILEPKAGLLGAAAFASRRHDG